MKTFVPFAICVFVATPALADGLTGRALFGYEQFAYQGTTRTGLRQTYDLRLDRALTGAARFAIFFRGDDFRGSSENFVGTTKSDSRQLRPGGEFVWSTSNVVTQIRSERFDTLALSSGGSDRRLERSTATLSWTPDKLPTLRIIGDRNTTTDDGQKIRLVDQSAVAGLNYAWNDLAFNGEQRFLRSSDDRAGYQRNTGSSLASVAYSTARLGGKLMVTADGSGQLTRIDELGLSTAAATVVTPVPIARALDSVDDTPLDGRDHPPVVNPALTDNDLGSSAGIPLGPDGASFQNIIVDVGRVDRVDEVRLFVRDGSRGPLRNGGGSVTWDAYTSEDGTIWTPLASQTTFNAAFSAYSVTFSQIGARWLKVVNFGVNGEPTFLTEVQLYVHTTIAPGEHRKGQQSVRTGTTTFVLRPVERLSFMYTGMYSSLSQALGSLPRNATTDLEHSGAVKYDLLKTVSLRGQYVKRSVRGVAGSGDDYATVGTGYLDYVPTGRLRVTLELGQQQETLEGSRSTIETRALHLTGNAVPSVQVVFDVGVQNQTIAADKTAARRDFANLAATAQLTRTIRLLLNGNLQRVETESTDRSVLLLGPSRDNRVSAEFVWRPGRELSVATRLGWVSGAAISSLTQRYHVEWFPFAGGTVSLGGSYDEDIDPATNRRATRAVFNPHWQMNRFTLLDFNYTAVTTRYYSAETTQRSILASVTLMK